MTEDYKAADVEKKWQKRWYDSDIWQANTQPDKKKYFLMFAYPGTSGFLHVGHMRGYTYSDIITRFKRMTGHNVLFPVGAHASGNLSQSFARKVERGDLYTLELLKAGGASPEEIEKLKDPLHVVKFLSQVYVNDYWRKFGFLVDWRRFMTTIDPGYQKFIEWQFMKLKEAGLLIQKPYYGTACMNCGPVAVDASETDISQGGNAEKQLWTLLKFRMGEEYVIAATLRPETVYGQTNFWVNPDVEYVKLKVGNDIWIVSAEAAEKLSFQMDDIKVVGTIAGSELIGKKVIAPVIEREILILPSKFTDPDFGSGLVTSVPSDAPYDWIALVDLANNPEECAKHGLDCADIKAIQPIPIINSKGWGPNPGVEIVEKMGIRNQEDERLEEATQEIYKVGFHTGRMNNNCGEYAGLPVAVAKDQVRDMMIAIGVADLMYDLSEPVICRCGGKVIVKQIPDQWFINYADQELTDRTVGHVEDMNITPQEYKTNLPGILDWFQERACARLGNWLGTNFPFDKRWIIEPISDSTLYSAYYLVSPYVNDGGVKPEQMDEAFFDYVFLGKGDANEISKANGIGPDVLSKVRADYEYWYPIDINLGGKEHMTVHFPVYLMNHAAILPWEDFPRGILVNWYIVMAGGKVSKSKGGAQPIPDVASLFTVDGLRLYYSHIANPYVDVEWDEASVRNSRQRTERIWTLANELMDIDGQAGPMDAWLDSRMFGHVLDSRNSLEKYELRDAANATFFETFSDLRWYVRRGGASKEIIGRALNAWVRMMASFTPHMAEELWEKMGGEGFVSVADFPEASDFKMDKSIELAEEYIRDVQADITGILKMTEIKPSKICIYTLPQFKNKIFQIAFETAQNGMPNMSTLMSKAMEEQDLKERAKDVSAFGARLAKSAFKFGDAEKLWIERKMNEKTIMDSVKTFFSTEFKCEVEIYQADESNIYDPQNKKSAAFPFKPAIFIE